MPDAPNPFDESVGLQDVRAALQVNPYPYLAANGQQDDFGSAEAFNEAMTAAAAAAGIGLVAITDHHRWQPEGLDEALQGAGIEVLRGVEITSSGNVHVLAIFDVETDPGVIAAVVAECGQGPTQTPAVTERRLYEVIVENGGVCIAAHVLTGAGLLAELRGQARVDAWTDERLLAACVDKSLPVSEVEDLAHRRILENRDAECRRERPLALLNSADVTRPEDFAKVTASSYMRMTRPSLESLRLALTDHDGRIQRPDALDFRPHATRHGQIVGIEWEGGQLDRVQMPLHDRLNVLIGGRGSGKSTVVESVRHVLCERPSGERAMADHDSLVEHVIGRAASLSLHVVVDGDHFIIKREGEQETVVTNLAGIRLEYTPWDLLPDLRILGQHEIADVARVPESRLRLVEPFIEELEDRDALRDELRRSRERQLEAVRLRTGAEERDQERRQLGLDLERLKSEGIEAYIASQSKEQTRIAHVRALVKWASELNDQLDRIAEDLLTAPPEASEDAVLASVDAAISARAQGVSEALESLSESGVSLDNALAAALEEREGALKSATEEANALLRRESTAQQQAASVYRLRNERHTELGDTEADLAAARDNCAAVEDERAGVLARQQLAAEHHSAQRATAAKRLRAASRRRTEAVELDAKIRALHGRVTDALSLISILEDCLSGQRDKVREALRARHDSDLSALHDNQEPEPLTGVAFVKLCEGGLAALQSELPEITDHQGASLIEAIDGDLGARLLLEEVTYVDRVELQLHVDGEWRDLERLSMGQQATVVLLTLLANEQGPLVLDQPEDDLDNEFVVGAVVPLLRHAKPSQQYLLTTHNANIPVLGDADLVTVLRPGTSEDGTSRIAVECAGAIDDEPVQDQITRLLEGGRTALDERRRRYRSDN